MNDRRPEADRLIAAYRAEVLRWNRQINLVSRQDTALQLDGLIRQCDRALDAVLAEQPELARGPVLYADLGSGGGLPGFVWHRKLLKAAPAVQSWLVEPREKRAWFLQRVARLADPRPYEVLCGRWGEVAGAAVRPAETGLVSLKALRLTDPEVLDGLAALGVGAADRPRRVVIVRFHPEDEVWTPELASALAVAPVGAALGPWRGAGASILVPPTPDCPPVGLVVSVYEARDA